jgi:hypothetical protein
MVQVLSYNANAPLWFEVHAYMESIGYLAVDILELHYSGKLLFQVDLLFRRTSPVEGIPARLLPAVNQTVSESFLKSLDVLRGNNRKPG